MHRYLLTRREALRLTLGASLARLIPFNLQAPRPVPSPSQLTWQRDELAMFIHFGVNTFSNREWGEGKEDPAIFNPTRLDAAQWARTARDAVVAALRW